MQHGTVLISARFKIFVAVVVLAACALRLWAAAQPALFAPDETGQYLEQAHRIVFGYGAVPWEYRYGIRNWILPLWLTGPMAAGAAIAPDTILYLILPKMLGAIASLSILWAAFDIGRRASATHAVVALCVIALWFEAIFLQAARCLNPWPRLPCCPHLHYCCERRQISGRC